ncbi:MAG TPA: TerC family protein [Longimicrobiales bacterium]|nr:TerC family protein [Longimicrobiales bacterium]
MQVTIWFWVLFNLFILGMLALDLGVFHRRAHAISLREAAIWSAVWIALSLLFNLGIYLFAGSDYALAFLTGYLIEKALSVDNIFVMVLIFGYFGVAPKYQHRVLFWGIIGALIMRGAFIVVGTVLLHKFHWVMYGFGALLVITGTRMAFREEKPFDAEGNRLLRLARRLIPVTPQYHEKHFLVRHNGRIHATPLLLVLILVEFTDLVFAVDSIPAVFAVTTETFLVYTSNVFAILGLRSLYFLLAGIVHKFRYLKYGLAFILVFVGVKMLLSDIQEVPIAASLIVIALSLTVSIAVSLIYPETDEVEEDSPPDESPLVTPQSSYQQLRKRSTG